MYAGWFVLEKNMQSQHRVWLGGLSLMCSLGLGCGGDDAQPGQMSAGSGGVAVVQMAPVMPATGTGGAPAMITDTQGSAGMVAPSTMGTGGAAPMMGAGGSGGAMAPQGMPLAMNECDLHTKYAGDEYCIKPPPADKGFQLHIGPSNYDNPEPEYILAPNQEATNNFAGVSGNDKPVHFYYRQFRMRDGAHHNIVTASDGGGFGMGRRIGTTNHLAEDSPVGGIIAPENKGVGIPLAAKVNINVSLHSINTTEQTQLREVWINFWYRDEAEVTDEVNEMFEAGDVGFQIQPGQDTILGPFTCDVTGTGRMLWMYGHRHANNVRFSTWRVRGGQSDIIYEAKDWEEPLVLEYSSTVTNATPDLDKNIEGGWNGILDLKPGDQIKWECHVINQTDGTLMFTNNTYTGEMCIVDAELVGASCAAALPSFP